MSKESELELLAGLNELIRSGEALRLRQKAGIHQSDIGLACDASAAAVSRWERGLRRPRGSSARKYAAALEILRKAETLRKANP